MLRASGAVAEAASEEVFAFAVFFFAAPCRVHSHVGSYSRVLGCALLGPASQAPCMSRMRRYGGQLSSSIAQHAARHMLRECVEVGTRCCRSHRLGRLAGA
jgi:hypothetical protein